MFIVFFGSVVLRDSPLNAVQMLWVNLVMDTLGALALATEPPAKSILLRAPYKKDNPIVTDIMWRNVFGHAFLQIIILTVILFVGQGTLCYNYSTKCMEFDSNNECTKYNPFYAEGLYENAQTIAGWESLGLTRDNFDKTLLDAMACDKVKQGNPLLT